MTMQLPLFSRHDEAKRLRRVILRAARDVAQQVGPKVIAPELDLGPSALMDCIEERERHCLTLKQICEVLAFDDRGVILAALAEATNHEPPIRKPQLDDSARLECLLRSLARAGPAGVAILEDAKFGGRP